LIEYFFNWVDKSELTPEYVSLIEQSEILEGTESGRSAMELIVENLAQVWVYIDAEGGFGILITVIQDGEDDERQLCLWRFFGHHLNQHIKDRMLPSIEEFARANNCTKLVSIATFAPMGRYLERVHGFKKTGTNNDYPVLERVV